MAAALDEGFVDVCAVDALPPGHKQSFAVGRYTVAVVNLGGALHAIDDTCPHRGGHLSCGDLLGAELYCPLHAWPFDVRTGRCTLFEEAQVRVFDVRVEAGRILVALEGRFT
jgi:nitrite reductase (NADH) small subunit